MRTMRDREKEEYMGIGTKIKNKNKNTTVGPTGRKIIKIAIYPKHSSTPAMLQQL